MNEDKSSKNYFLDLIEKTKEEDWELNKKINKLLEQCEVKRDSKATNDKKENTQK